MVRVDAAFVLAACLNGAVLLFVAPLESAAPLRDDASIELPALATRRAPPKILARPTL
jgi:hypothetical protein